MISRNNASGRAIMQERLIPLLLRELDARRPPGS